MLDTVQEDTMHVLVIEDDIEMEIGRASCRERV